MNCDKKVYVYVKLSIYQNFNYIPTFNSNKSLLIFFRTDKIIFL